MSWLDISILIIYLLAVLAIGWHYRRSAGNGQEHFLAGRRMTMLPVGLSIMVTSFSAINYLAIPEEVSSHGLYVIFSFPVFFLAAWPISHLWMPFFNRLQGLTVYEFLENRFDPRVRHLTSLLFLLWRLAWMAVALYASAKILSVFTGYNPRLMIAVCGIAATAYTCLGGMRAVMWTDVLQFIIIITSIILAVVLAIQSCPEGVFSTAFSLGNLKPIAPPDYSFFSLNPTIRMTFWSVIIGTLTAFLTRYGADQVVMQRYFAAKDLRQAQRGLWLNAAASFLALSLLALLGLAIAVRGSSNGSEIPAIRQLNEMVRQFPNGFAGLLTAGLLAATMSSIDSGINGCAASLTNDLKCGWPVRLLSIVIGLAVTVLALVLLPALNAHQSIFVIINRMINGIGSPLLVIIILGMFSRHATAAGVFYGAILGTVASLALTIFCDSLALQYYATANFLITWLSCLAFSALLPSVSSD